MPIKQLSVIAKKELPEKADMQVTINVTDAGAPTGAPVIVPVEPLLIPPACPTVLPPAVAIAPAKDLVQVLEEQSPPMLDSTESDAEAIVAFLKMYLNLVGCVPSQAQIENLATSMGWDRLDLQVILVRLTGGEVDDEITNTTRDADLEGNPGLNIPGNLDAFANDDLNPNGRTSLHDIEMPGTLKLFSSASKDIEFMQPMSYLDGGAPPVEKIVADLAIEVNTEGTDDGAPVSEAVDDAEQQALIDDGEIEQVDKTEQMNDTRYLNDDGLT